MDPCVQGVKFIKNYIFVKWFILRTMKLKPNCKYNGIYKRDTIGKNKKAS